MYGPSHKFMLCIFSATLEEQQSNIQQELTQAKGNIGIILVRRRLQITCISLLLILFQNDLKHTQRGSTLKGI